MSKKSNKSKKDKPSEFVVASLYGPKMAKARMTDNDGDLILQDIVPEKVNAADIMSSQEVHDREFGESNEEDSLITSKLESGELKIVERGKRRIARALRIDQYGEAIDIVGKSIRDSENKRDI